MEIGRPRGSAQRRLLGETPSPPPLASSGKLPDMSINAIIALCLQRARESGLPPQKQHEVAAHVLREVRPEWSDSQIADTISRVQSSGTSEMRIA